MRLNVFLLLVAALYAHAATIPVAESEKKIIDVVPDDLDKTENLSSEQELIDQANTIKDVENKLRVKTEDIPVKVIVEQAEPVLKTTAENEESEEINRPIPDLRNPGPPQRQEHETQNPGYYAHEQQANSNFKQSIIEAQNVLKQGFQGITDGIKSMLENNEPIQTIQHNIQTLREGFTAKINKLNETIQSYIEGESPVNQPAVQQTKSDYQAIEKGLKVLKNDFNKGVNTLADGIEVVAYLKAEGESNPSSGSNPVPVNPTPSGPFASVVAAVQNMQQSFMNTLQGFIGTNSTEVPAGAQSDSQVVTTTPSPPNPIWTQFQTSFSNFFESFSKPNQISNQIPTQISNQIPSQITNQIPTQITNQIPTQITNQIPTQITDQFGGQTNPIQLFIFQFLKPTDASAQQGSHGKPEQTTSKPSEVTTVETKPETHSENKTEKPENHQVNTVKQVQVAAVTSAGPIRQILQNNPISKGIANAVQHIQNINNPEKPRDDDKHEKETKGHYGYGGYNSGDNNDSNISGIKENAVVKEEIEKLPEVQKPKEHEIKEHKTDEGVDKTE